MVVTLLLHKNCSAHQELVAGRLSMNDMKNNLSYSVLLSIVFAYKSFENNYFIVIAFKTYI
jgi:hypothetical protein